MDGNRVNPLSETESSAGQSVGLLELWDGARPIVCHQPGVV